MRTTPFIIDAWAQPATHAAWEKMPEAVRPKFIGANAQRVFKLE